MTVPTADRNQSTGRQPGDLTVGHVRRLAPAALVRAVRCRLNCHAPQKLCRTNQRRGAAYTLALGVAMLVTVIGVSAILAARVELRGARGTQNVAAARYLAQSAVEYGLQKVVTDANWRTTYTHDVWTTPITLGMGEMRFKLVDDDNGSLTSDESAPVRLYGMGTVDDAVRIYSVKLDATGQETSNLIVNGGFEDGLTGWACTAPCNLSIQSSNPYEGDACLGVDGRTQNQQGPSQVLQTTLANGRNYTVELWIKGGLLGGSCTVRLGGVADGGPFSDKFSESWLLGGWTKITGTLTPSWSGTLTSAAFQVNTSNAIQVSNFKLDAVSLLPAGSQSAYTMSVAGGTWRRETAG